MSEKYLPPFTMTEDIMNMVIEIGELVGQISVHDNLSTNPKLRRDNRIKTIHSSLAIEQNTLTLAQVTDIIEGKRVLAPPADYVPDLINQLFAWLKKSNMHPLVKSCIFHYEFEFIHPFSEGKHSIGQMIIKSKYQAKLKIKELDIFLFHILLLI